MFEYYNLISAFLISFSLSIFFVLTQNFHGIWTNDSQKGVQKIHKNPTSRIGGLSIIISLFLIYLFIQLPRLMCM